MTKNTLLESAKALKLYSLEPNWDKISADEDLLRALERIVRMETKERERRRLESCIKSSKVTELEPVVDFDWNWPRSIDKKGITELFSFEFIDDKENVVFIGSNGVGKTMFSKNLVHEAAVKGIKAVFIEASVMLTDLIGQSSRTSLQHAIQKYVKPQLLAIDEVGYLSYDTRHADLLFQVINRRVKKTSTIITTNKRFQEWNQVFPNATSVTALIDRIIERCNVFPIDADSYRAKRYKERAEAKARKHSSKK